MSWIAGNQEIRFMNWKTTFIKTSNATIIESTPHGNVWSEYIGRNNTMTKRLTIKSDKTFLLTCSVILRWKIVDRKFVKIYDKDKNKLWGYTINESELK